MLVEKNIGVVNVFLHNVTYDVSCVNVVEDWKLPRHTILSVSEIY